MTGRPDERVQVLRSAVRKRKAQVAEMTWAFLHETGEGPR